MQRPHLARSAGLAALTAALIAAPLSAPAYAVSGTAETEGSLAFTARLDIGDGQRACSGALVDREWLLTAASCFADDPAVSLAVPAGSPKLRTTATIGRTDLTTTAGEVRTVVEVVAHPSRDAALVRLNRPVTTIAPVAISATAATVGEQLKVAGYGRTKDEWAPLKLHSGAFAVDAVNATEADLTGQNGVSVCMGDTGGPALRVVNGQAELVALNSRSSQAGCFGIDAAVTSTAAINTRVDDLRAWVDAKVVAPRFTDFNCDGAEDIAIGDPKATVGGDANAGLIRVLYGGGKGTGELHQDLASIPGGAEPHDWYGEQLATFDHNEDGCTDLLVGIPAEDIGSESNAGAAHVIYGAKGGLATGQATLNLVQGAGAGGIKASKAEAGDRFGHSVAAGHTAAGEPWLMIGVPNEDHSSVTDAGSVHYLRGSVNTVIHQEKPGVAGVAEAGDKFGISVAGGANHIAIGTPYEDIGTVKDAGGFQVLKHALSSAGIPTPLWGGDQNSDGISGVAEDGDHYGYAVSVADYRPSGAATATDSIIAVGAPGEGLRPEGSAAGTAERDNAGFVPLFRVTGAGALTEIPGVSQEVADVSGGAETGDRFGEVVKLVNTAPRAVGTNDTMVLAVGIPGEDLGTTADAGAVQTFGVFGPHGDHDRWIEAGNSSGLPGPYAAGQRVGKYIHGTATNLYIGRPYNTSTHGVLHSMPWGNATAGRIGTAGSVTTYQPGQGGLPAAGLGFGFASS
ncbi:S1 family peptidase [Streptomyces sp. TRM49041]|uniref:S1 family peptidase n=1 Tax=Streptomyces sp. TRM49041 TaxID=2603216 RepID=UPI0011ED1F3C|nr:S1 family peptidase [Streptomyces sp. TRM49041]